MSNIKKDEKEPHFLVKLSSFIIILFILDCAIGALLKHFYFKQNSGLLYRTTYAIDSTQAEMLIFGSSTANHQYIPDIFNKQLHLSCYNTGRDGNSILYSYAIFRGIVKRYTPKIIILDVYAHEFMKDQNSYDRISSLLPYYDKHPEIRTIVQLRSPFEKYKLKSKIYPFNSLLFTIGIGNANFNKERKYINDQNGYIPYFNTWKQPLLTDSSLSKYDLDSTKINVFKSFINDCLKLNIDLYVFLSPKFIKYIYEDTTAAIANKVTLEYNIPFFDFTNDSFFLNHRNLYFDKSHLNDNGAKIFCEIVSQKIMQYRKDKLK